ncbi:DUF1616 domain-containing protein [Candidatus Pacearchaeota archaeon]|nr:DUF1616 domain-containing protein [Candidatus Pacearchaeota archaeon]
MSPVLYVAIIRAVCGLILVLFLPGYLLSMLFIHDVDVIERMVFSIGLSIATTVAVSFFLTALQWIFGFGRFSQEQITVSLSMICILQLIYIGVRQDAGSVHRP